ncbi:hypothetical protein ACS0TY_018817 [Phlomoides rotata]
MLQAMHQSELSRWWKGLEVPTKLSFARDRLVENYFWDSGVYFEPQYARARIILSKVQCLISVTDDTFDAYANFEELQLFTDAIQRWSISCLDQLPDYMKIIYKALLEVFEEIEKEMIKQGTIYRLNYGIEVLEIWLEILTQSTILKIKTKSTQRLYEDCRRLFLVDKV